nr:VOC family protein [Polymorphobacter sp.]
MRVNALDHVNIIAKNLDATASFYEVVLGLERRNGPPPLSPENAQWMFDISGRAIVHINTHDAPKAVERVTNGLHTGAVHHVALNCSGHDEMRERLRAFGIDCVCNEISAIGLRQIFVSDPNDVLLELNFFAE